MVGHTFPFIVIYIILLHYLRADGLRTPPPHRLILSITNQSLTARQVCPSDAPRASCVQLFAGLGLGGQFRHLSRCYDNQRVGVEPTIAYLAVTRHSPELHWLASPFREFPQSTQHHTWGTFWREFLLSVYKSYFRSCLLKLFCKNSILQRSLFFPKAPAYPATYTPHFILTRLTPDKGFKNSGTQALKKL